MHAEITCAAAHISGLLSNHTQPTAPSLEEFRSTLVDSLASLYSKSWYPTDPDRGSAFRALHWQPGPGGEGCSSPLLKACNQHRVGFGEREWTLWVDPGCVAIRAGAGPGRVHGPVSLSPERPTAFSQEGVRVLYGAPSPIKKKPLARPVSNGPLLTLPPQVSKAAIITRPPIKVAASSSVPSVTVSPSTPALGTELAGGATPVVPWSKKVGLGHGLPAAVRARRTSNASDDSDSSSRRGSVSSSSSSHASMNRTTSLETTSSIGTSIPATSPPASASWCKLDFDGAEGRPRPEIGDDFAKADLHGLGLEDCGLDDGEVGPDDAVSATGGDDDEDDEVEVADETVHHSLATDHGEGDDTIRSLNEGDDTICPMEEAATKVPEASINPSPARKNMHRSTPSSVSVTSFDNGNVGVLGGGVKLGGSSTAGSSRASRSRAMSSASNVSAISAMSNKSRSHQSSRNSMSRTGGWAAQQQQQLQQQQQQYHFNVLGLANMQHGIGYQSNGEPQASYHIIAASHSHQSADRRQENRETQTVLKTQPLLQRRQGAPALVLSQHTNGITPDTSSLETPKLGGCFPLPSPALSSSTGSSSLTDEDDEDGEDGDDEEMDGENDGTDAKGPLSGKRTRTRGRRSRGRGAGRAARRAAAAAAAGGMVPGLPTSPLHSPLMTMGQWQPSLQLQQQPLLRALPSQHTRQQPPALPSPHMPSTSHFASSPAFNYQAQMNHSGRNAVFTPQFAQTSPSIPLVAANPHSHSGVINNIYQQHNYPQHYQQPQQPQHRQQQHQQTQPFPYPVPNQQAHPMRPPGPPQHAGAVATLAQQGWQPSTHRTIHQTAVPANHVEAW